MEALPEPLPDDPDSLKALIQTLVSKNECLQGKNILLEERLRILLHKRFGASSEKTSPNQQDLFNEAEHDQSELETTEPVEAEDVIVPEYTRKKRGRKPLPKHLPRVCEEHDLSEDEKQCSCCGGELHRIGEEISE